MSRPVVRILAGIGILVVGGALWAWQTPVFGSTFARDVERACEWLDASGLDIHDSGDCHGAASCAERAMWFGRRDGSPAREEHVSRAYLRCVRTDGDFPCGEPVDECLADDLMCREAGITDSAACEFAGDASIGPDGYAAIMALDPAFFEQQD